MSQADKERVIAELAKRYEDVNEYRWDNLISDLYDAGEKAGYRAAREDAAIVARQFLDDKGMPARGNAVAAAIRELGPK